MMSGAEFNAYLDRLDQRDTEAELTALRRAVRAILAGGLVYAEPWSPDIADTWNVAFDGDVTLDDGELIAVLAAVDEVES